ncbi:MAG: PAS domain S-box protein [Desulfobacterales bacterium]
MDLDREKSMYSRLIERIKYLENEKEKSKKQIRELRESEQKYRFLTEGVSDIVWTLDLDLNPTYVSPLIEKSLGFTPEERMRQKANKMMTPDSFEKVKLTLERELAAECTGNADPERTTRIETDYFHKNGCIVPMENVVRGIRNNEGKLIGIQGVSRDITERKKAEIQIQQEKGLSDSIINSLPGIFYLFDEKRKILRLNRRFERVTGYAKDELVRFEPPSLFNEQESPLIEQSIRETFRTGKSTITAHIVSKTGERTPFYLTGARLELNERSCLVGVGVDITHLKKAEEALEEKNKLLQNITDNMLDLLALTDTRGNVKFLSASHRALGYDPDKEIGENVLKNVHPDDLEKAAAALTHSFRNGKWRRKIQYRHLKADGGYVWLETIGTFIKDSNGKIKELVVSSRDITEVKQAEQERKRMQAQFTQAQKMESVGRLAGGIAHDFNNMLNVIIGYADLAMAKIPPSSPIRNDLQEILTAGRRSTEIVRQLLAFARKQIIAPRSLHLNTTIEDGVIKMLRRLIGEHIDLIWKPGKHVQKVIMDPVQLDQILANLIVNARDAIEGVGKIIIETGMAVLDQAYCKHHPGFIPGEFVLLTVSDNGCGIDKAVLNKVFEPFFTTKEIGYGTGLGLATVYGIVKQNNGFINAYSEPGLGTTFKIYLPVHSGEAGMDRPEKKVKTPQGRGETILIVEDEETIVDLAKAILEKLGYHVLAAQTPGHAVRLAQTHAGNIDLLLTDVVLPEMNGRTMADHISALNPDIKVVFMSGYTSNIIAHHGVLNKGVHFIQKPFSNVLLAEKVREVLDEK